MRYIRDIINEKKQEPEMKRDVPRRSPRTAEMTSPLILSEPVVPGQVQSTQDDAPEKASVTQVKRTVERSGTPTQHAKIAPKRAQPSEGSNTARPVKSHAPEEASMDDDENNVLNGQNDPFDNIRQTARPLREGATSVSPLRTARPEPTQPEQPAKPESQPAAETQAPTRPVDEPIEEEPLTPLVDALNPGQIKVPGPAAGRGSKVSARVKTRLLGFSAEAFTDEDPIKSGATASSDFPVGWLVVVSEQGRGKSFALRDGVSSVGRGADQTVCLDIGDNSISRENHISIAFDAEQKKFFVGHGGKTNLVRVNNKPLLSTEELSSKDMIRLGETTLRFLAFCDETFNWDQQTEQQAQRA